jgi:FtsZ-interacting cell division protein ZipA
MRAATKTMNLQILCITIEIILFLAIMFWIYTKERQSAIRVKGLFQKLDEQENRILVLETIVARQAANLEILYGDARESSDDDTQELEDSDNADSERDETPELYNDKADERDETPELQEDKADESNNTPELQEDDP